MLRERLQKAWISFLVVQESAPQERFYYVLARPCFFLLGDLRERACCLGMLCFISHTIMTVNKSCNCIQATTMEAQAAYRGLHGLLFGNLMDIEQYFGCVM